ncbi:M48 family metalloprotease [Streptomyces sp. NPDC059582]|uniref:M48 family metallopeptidase n=1 Tax=Streptomyces sp. NPDC059582 TaxID=3346875 RepID=UPI0036820B0C
MDIQPKPLREWLLIGAMLAVAGLPLVIVPLGLILASMLWDAPWPVLIPLLWPLGTVVAGAVGTVTGRDRIPGRAVRPKDEPELCALVRDVAERAGFQEPLLVQVVPDADASLGRVRAGGVRAYALVLGLPLLRALTAAELASVIAHELGHERHIRDRRTHLLQLARGALTARLDRRFRPLAPLATPLLRATQPQVWRAETAADADAVRVAGTAATAEALRRSGMLHAAFEGLGGAWWAECAEKDMYPEDFYDALDTALRDPLVAHHTARAAAADEEEAALDPYAMEGHPPTAERIAALPADVEASSPYGDAPVVLRTAESLESWCVKEIAEVEDAAVDNCRPVRLLDLPDDELHDLDDGMARALLLRATGQEALEQAVSAALDSVADGTWPRLARRLEPGLRWMPATVRPVTARRVLAVAVTSGLESVLREAGWTYAGRWLNSVLTTPEGTVVVDLRELVTDALTDGEPAPVRDLLATAGTRQETAA